MSGQPVDSSARRQLTRLHGLAGRLTSADPSSSLVADPVRARRRPRHANGCASTCSSGRTPWHAPLPSASRRRCWPPGRGCGYGRRRPVGLAAADRRGGRGRRCAGQRAWAPFREVAEGSQDRSSWAVPVPGPSGPDRRDHRVPARHRPPAAGRARPGVGVRRLRRERGGAGPAARPGHRAQPGAGDDPGDAGDAGRPLPVPEGLAVALRALRRGLQADEVALLSQPPGGTTAQPGACREPPAGPSVPAGGRHRGPGARGRPPRRQGEEHRQRAGG